MTLIHQGSTDQSLTQDSGNVFRVRWQGGAYPKPEDNTCKDGCTPVGLDACVCETTVQSTAVFTNMAALPSTAQVEANLLIGSPPPDSFVAGVYSQCTSAECAAAATAGVTVFLHSGSGNSLDQRTIFRINLNNTRPAFFANKAATVRVAGGAFSFRNPPKFNSFARPSIRDAEHETDALIDHLFWHKNV